MTKLEEIINKYVPPHCQGSWYKEMMIEYAKICLEKAAEEATFIMTVQPIKKDGFIEGYKKAPIINKESITNIELP